MPLNVPEPDVFTCFAAHMAALGPWGPSPSIAVGVSGGADSLALALLAARWAGMRMGSMLALIVDHGLRPEAALEARDAAATLMAQGIPAKIVTLSGLRGTAAATRAARLTALEAYCAAHGILHLLLAQHAGDQAETRLMRRLAGSSSSGQAGMSAVRFSGSVRIVRPLLGVAPRTLRQLVCAAGLSAVRDPSNTDPRALRARLRMLRLDAAGTGPATRALCAAARADGLVRAAREAALAGELARMADIYPAGYAYLRPGPWSEAALAALVRTLGGHDWPSARVARLAADPRPATLAGLRLIRRRGGFWLLREEAAVEPLRLVRPGRFWDRRFLIGDSPMFKGKSIGALGDDAPAFRRRSGLPAAILRVLPAIRDAGGELLAVPHLGWPDPAVSCNFPVIFAPSVPLAGASFQPAS